MANWGVMWEALILILVVVVVAPDSASSSSKSDNGPFIVAHKKATVTRLKSGAERISVSIDIYNQGSATAYDVTLNDDSWSKDVFDIVAGNTSMSWERLDVGALLSHTFELEAKVKTLFYGAPAVITFRVPTKAVLQVWHFIQFHIFFSMCNLDDSSTFCLLPFYEAFSTPILPIDILADRSPEKKFELAKRLFAKYGSLTSVLSIVTLFVYLIATPSKSGAGKTSKKKH